MVSSVDVRGLALRTLMPGFPGTSVPSWLDSALADGLGSVCLYGSNVVDREQLRGLCADLRARSSRVVLAVDEEGGDVTRLHYRTGSPYPGNAVLGRLDEVDLTRASAATIGADLVEVGVDLDLAPVVDVNSSASNPVIGTRSFGAEADLVARHGVAWVEGLQSTGVAACAKHFPGHGDTTDDSHRTLPVVTAPAEVLRSRELAPFAAAVRAGVACVMTAAVVVPALDPVNPATFSATPAAGRAARRARFPRRDRHRCARHGRCEPGHRDPGGRRARAGRRVRPALPGVGHGGGAVRRDRGVDRVGGGRRPPRSRPAARGR